MSMNKFDRVASDILGTMIVTIFFIAVFCLAVAGLVWSFNLMMDVIR